MACPHLREVVMLFCDGCPHKKLLPLDRLATANPCLGDFHNCPMFQEVLARQLSVGAVVACAESGRKERAS